MLDACITVHDVKLIFNVQLKKDKLVHEEKPEIPEGEGSSQRPLEWKF